jgi:hypothetical protein
MPGFYLPSENEFDPSIDDFVIRAASKERHYKHFDLQLSSSDRIVEIDFSQEESPHRFLPFLGFTDVTRRYIRVTDENGNKKRVPVKKSRPIRFAGHADAAYLQAYAEYLNNFYEDALVKDGTTGSVLAYRKGGGTNIHHAKSLFDEIVRRADCSVFALDISSFFDCLNHRLLRNEVANLLGVKRLEGHHATVWKNLTRYSWVETSDLDEVLGKNRKMFGRICSQLDFKTYVRGRKQGLVRTHDLDCGIPQGTPISGLYANIYMRAFDREMIALCGQYGGSYRRYSDDIAVVLPLGTKIGHVVSIVEKVLADFSLAISTSKTEAADFRAGLLESSKPIQYLGFTFDGKNTLIRQSSIDNYRRKMRRGILAKLVAAKKKGIHPSSVFQRELRSRYTHAGKRRNFIRYAYKAADVMDSPEIREQLRRHVTWFDRAWKSEVSKVYG